MNTLPTKRTRAERKAARRAEWAKTEAQREQYRREHPVLSGAVPVVDYVPPCGGSHRLSEIVKAEQEVWHYWQTAEGTRS
jgi:hypothetical protein